MQFLDKKFLKHKKAFSLQCLMATATAFVVLLLLDTVSNAAIIAALGSSSFIAFTMPHSEVSKPRHIIGGYIIGIIVGCLCYSVACLPGIQDCIALSNFSNVFFCALAIGISTFLMVITNTEHPPATGLALGLFLNHCDIRTIIVILLGGICLIIIKTLLEPLMQDLI